MCKQLINLSSRSILLAATVLSSFISCQRAMLPATDTYQQYITRPRPVVVRGQFFASRDTTSAMIGYRVIFSRKLVDRSIEQAEATRISPAGFYRVRVRAGKTYEIGLLIGDCRVETQEFAVPDQPQDSVVIKNFYMYYPDSTEYGGCLAGWRPRLAHP